MNGNQPFVLRAKAQAKRATKKLQVTTWQKVDARKFKELLIDNIHVMLAKMLT